MKSGAWRAVPFLQTVLQEPSQGEPAPSLSLCRWRRGVQGWGDWLVRFWEHLLNNELYPEGIALLLKIILIVFVMVFFTVAGATLGLLSLVCIF